MTGGAQAAFAGRRLKIAHLSSVHSPGDVRILHKECATLAAAGHDVVFIVPGDGEASREGVRIRYLPVPTGRKARVLKTVPELYQVALAEQADIYHFHDPELMPVGLWLRLRGRRVVYDVHEDAPRDILTKTYLAKPVRWLAAAVVECLEWIAGRTLSGIVAVTRRIAARFPTRKTVLVQNFPLHEELVEQSEVAYQDRDPIVAYTGGIAAIRGAREMLEAVDLLPESMEARLTMAGLFSPPAFEAELRQMPGWSQVDFLGWRSREDVSRMLGRARVALVLFHPLANHVDAQPNKLFEYMAAGVPVVASDFPLWREIVEGAGCGLLADPMQPAAVAGAIRWLLEHPDEAEAMGRRGQEAVRARFNWRREGEKLVAFYDRITAGGER